jgi:predicted SAM-dependent methyltransferase
VGGPVLLDLGCGNKREAGWTAVDQPGNYSGQPPDVEADLRALPFPDNYADGARAIHVIEHFYAWEAGEVMREWVRVLKPGAELAIECPCLDKVLALANVPEVPPQYIHWALYGDPRYKDPSMVHKWAYTKLQMVKLMTQAGLVNIRPEPCQFHAPIRDMRFVGMKAPDEPRIVVAE